MTNLPIIFQDDSIVIIDKPVNLAVHKNDFMPNDAPYVTKILGEIIGKWIYNVHRLDAKTSGVMVFALTKENAHQLAIQFEQKQVQKTYMAIVEGNPGSGCFTDKVIVKKKSKFKKPAVTHFKTVKTIHTNINHKGEGNVELSLVKIHPETGRWHQIRQHFAKNRHDILGDTHHGDFKLNKAVTKITGIKRLYLHALKMSFLHPGNGEKIEFSTKTPNEFTKIITTIEFN